MNIFIHFLISFKFISLVPSVTETFYLLGAQDSLLAISHYCNYPEETREKARVGDLLNPDYEKILKIKPDFVIITLPMQKQVSRNLEKIGIPCITFNPESLEEILNMIDSLAGLTGQTKRGKIVTDSLKNLLSEVRPLNKRPSAYIELSENPLYTPGGPSFITEVFSFAGASNIFSDKEQPYFVPVQEEIIKRNPDFIFLIYPGANRKKVEKRFGWKSVNAIKRNRIYTLDPDLYTRPGPRIFGAIVKLNRLLQTSF